MAIHGAKINGDLVAESRVGSVVMESDSEIVAAARTGSTTAFQELVERYQHLVYSVAFALTGSVSDSEEVAQETFLVAWRRLDKLKAPHQVRSWLCGIVRTVSRRFRSTWQHGSRVDRVDNDDALRVFDNLPSCEPSPLDCVISAEEEYLIERCLRPIPATQPFSAVGTQLGALAVADSDVPFPPGKPRAPAASRLPPSHDVPAAESGPPPY